MGVCSEQRAWQDRGSDPGGVAALRGSKMVLAAGLWEHEAGRTGRARSHRALSFIMKIVEVSTWGGVRGRGLRYIAGSAPLRDCTAVSTWRVTGDVAGRPVRQGEMVLVRAQVG